MDRDIEFEIILGIRSYRSSISRGTRFEIPFKTSLSSDIKLRIFERYAKRNTSAFGRATQKG